MTDYRLKSNSNTHDVFETSKRTDLLICEVHRAVAKEISKGEEIILTRLDHDANISSWLILAEDKGARIVWVDIDPDDCTLGIEDYEKED
ncbi:MAG: aminotransferase class V-fold PLP-dependent enzyme [Candidatus Aminicenantia bacterium]